MSVKVIPKGRRSRIVPRWVGLVQAEKDGGPVLKIEASWRKVSGFYVNTRWGCVWFMIRRSGR